jgi:hypothetical protein
MIVGVLLAYFVALYFTTHSAINFVEQTLRKSGQAI